MQFDVSDKKSATRPETFCDFKAYYTVGRGHMRMDGQSNLRGHFALKNLKSPIKDYMFISIVCLGLNCAIHVDMFIVNIYIFILKQVRVSFL